MATRDLNLQVGTVTRDASRNVGIGSEEWLNPTYTNDGSNSTKASIVSGIYAFEDYLKSDLGAVYRVTAFNISAGTGPALLTKFQYWDGSAWVSPSYTETGSRSTTAGATLTFTTPIDARYFALGATATGGHSAVELTRWEILGDDLPPSAPVANFSGTPLSGFASMVVVFTDLSTNATTWSWDFGDGATSTTQHPSNTYTSPGVYTVALTVSNSGGSTATETKIDYITVTEQSAEVDLTQAVAYNGYTFPGITASPTGPSSGAAIERIDASWVETVGYDDKRALQDGKDAADTFLGERRVVINAGIYGSTRGATFDSLADVAAAFHPVTAYAADETNLGFLALDFYRPTGEISTWPTSTFPYGIPLRLYCRPIQPVTYRFVRDETGGVDGKGMAIKADINLWAKDPRFYLQTSQSIAITASTQTVTYRGDYRSFPVVSFTMSAAGSSVAQIVVAGGTVKIDLSGTTTGSYQIEYANRRIIKTSDGSLYNSIFDTSFAQDFREVKTGSTFWISSLTGISSITLDYREAFV